MGHPPQKHGYIDFIVTVNFKEKQKVPHSYSRAEENARLLTEFGMTDKKDYINLEIALDPYGTVLHGSLRGREIDPDFN